MDFETIKRDVQDFGHQNNACVEQFRRVLNSNDIHELSNIIKDNFYWCCQSIEEFSSLLKKHEEAFCQEKIYLNTSIKEGFLLASGNATVRASGNATVRAWDNATVRAWDNATVRAWGNATVRAWDNATVEASENATVRASGNAYILAITTIECKLDGNAILRSVWNNIILHNSDELDLSKQSE